MIVICTHRHFLKDGSFVQRSDGVIIAKVASVNVDVVERL